MVLSYHHHPCVSWELNTGLTQEQEEVRTAEPPLQPLKPKSKQYQWVNKWFISSRICSPSSLRCVCHCQQCEALAFQSCSIRCSDVGMQLEPVVFVEWIVTTHRSVWWPVSSARPSGLSSPQTACPVQPRWAGWRSNRALLCTPLPTAAVKHTAKGRGSKIPRDAACQQWLTPASSQSGFLSMVTSDSCKVAWWTWYWLKKLSFCLHTSLTCVRSRAGTLFSLFLTRVEERHVFCSVWLVPFYITGFGKICRSY